MPIVEKGVETMENDIQNGGVILPRRSDLPDWGPDFRPHRYFKRKFILLEKLVILLKNVTMCQFIHAKFHAELLDIRPRHAYPALAYLHARYSRGKGGREELLNKVLYVEAPHIPQLMKFLYSWLPVTRTLYSLNLPLTRSNFHFPSDRFLYNFTLDNSNSR